MPDTSFLTWPFFEDHHRKLATDLSRWAAEHVNGLVDHHDTDGSCRKLVKAMGEAGWLRAAVPAAYGGLYENFDVRALCLIRETLAYQNGLADFAFAMQGLGTGPITLYGSEEIKQRYLPRVAKGEAIAAFALSEPDAGSDVAAMSTTAVADGPDHVRINGLKTWISNGGIADQYVVFVRTGEAGARGISAFVIDADTPGFKIDGRIDVIAPHPLATLKFEDCRVPVKNRIGKEGEGFKVAMATPRSASAAARWMRACIAPSHERCSAIRWAICNSPRLALPKWRPPSTPQRCWFIAPPGPRIRACRA
jgi:acyl-CoA dehydrogenase